MIGRVSPDSLSNTCPPGNPSFWPLADALMLEDLRNLGEAFILFEGFGTTEAYHHAARLLQLPDDEYHWMVDFALCLFRDLFYCRSGDFYLDAHGFLKHADERDLAKEELTGQARWLVESAGTDL